MKAVRHHTLKMARILALAVATLLLPAPWALAGPGHGGGYGRSGGYGYHSNHNVTISGGYYGWSWAGYSYAGYSSAYGVYPVNGGFAPVVPSGPAIDSGGDWVENGATLFWVP